MLLSANMRTPNKCGEFCIKAIYTFETLSYTIIILFFERMHSFIVHELYCSVESIYCERKNALDTFSSPRGKFCPVSLKTPNFS